jgi:hypothetical protein
MLIFKTGEPEEKPLKQGIEREPTNNSTHMWRRVRESNPVVRRALTPLRQPCFPYKLLSQQETTNKKNYQMLFIHYLILFPRSSRSFRSFISTKTPIKYKWNIRESRNVKCESCIDFDSLSGVIGSSSKMERVLFSIERLKPTAKTVYIIYRRKDVILNKSSRKWCSLSLVWHCVSHYRKLFKIWQCFWAPDLALLTIFLKYFLRKLVKAVWNIY